MNATIARRCFWREYRMGRSFWIAMWVLTVGLQLVWLANNAYWHMSSSRRPLWDIAMVMPLIYAMGWAATAFSREHESGSFALLNTLPTTFTPIWLGKVGFTLISSLLLGLALTLATLTLGAVPQFDLTWASVWALWLITIAGIGTVCSQWIKRPLTATFVAGSFLAVISLWPTNGSMSMGQQVSWLNQGLLFLFGAVALVVSYAQTRPWLQDRLRWSVLRRPRAQARLAAGLQSGGSWRSPLGRFGWVAWRRLGVVGAMMLVAVLLSALFFVEAEDTVLQPLAFLVLAAWPVLLGATVFYCEQDPLHARFLIGQGVSPRQIWWSKQLLGTAILLAVCLSILPLLELRHHSHAARYMLETKHAYWPYVVLAYGAGQLVSITVRSTLVGLAVASFLGLVLIGWAALYTLLGIPLWIGVAIPVVGMLVTSRWRAQAWLLEWHGVRHWFAPAAALAGTLGLLFAAFNGYRATEIPRVPPAFDVAQVIARADERYNATAAEQIGSAADRLSSQPWPTVPRYQADSLQMVQEGDGTAVAWAYLPLPMPPAELAALEDAAELLTPALDTAIDQADGLVRSARWTWAAMRDRGTEDLQRLGRLYIARARAGQERGELAAAAKDFQRALQLCQQFRRGGDPISWSNAAAVEAIVLDNLIFWAAAARQDAEQVASLEISLLRYWADEPPWATPLEVEFIRTSRLVEGLPDSLDALPIAPEAVPFTYAMLLLPGEKARLRRLVNLQAWTSMSAFPTAVRQRLDGVRGVSNDTGSAWHETTPLSNFLRPSSDWLALSLADLQERRAAARLRLLLIEHRLRFGEYPAETEDRDVPDVILQRAERRVRQARFSGSSDAVSDSWSFDRFRYRRLSDDTPDRYAEFNEPLGSYVVDAQGALALRTDQRTYPLPTK